MEQNIIRGGGGGGGGDQHTPVESPDSLHSVAYANILDLVSEGEIVGPVDTANPLKCIYFNDTPAMNADGSVNFNNLQIDFRYGTQTQAPIKGFPGVENEISVGVEFTTSNPWEQTLTNLALTSVRVMLSVPQLVQTDSDDGDIHGTRVEYKIRLSSDGGAFADVFSGAFDGKTTSKYQRSHTIALPAATTNWVIRVERVTAQSTSAYLINNTWVESYTEIVEGLYRMPMSALVGTKIDSKQFNSIPSRAFHLKGRIIRVPTNYNPTTRAYTGVWDGTFKLAYTNNPAWVFLDMATNSRYGLGNYVTDAMVDKWTLYTIAQYCDELVNDGFGGLEPRFTANLYLQTQDDALRVMQNIATIFRGIMYAAGSAIVPCADKPDDPVYTFTPANVIGGKFTYGGSNRKVRHTVALVSWNDMSDMCRAKVEYVEDKDGIARYGVQPTEVIAVGCTSRGQAHRLGKYLLATERYADNTVQFAVGLDGAIPAPGKIINIADPLRAGKRMGGRIKAATINTLTLDALPSGGLVAGDTVTAIMPTGVPNKRTVSGVAGNVVTVSTNFDAIPVAQSVWLAEKSTLNAQTFRVLGVTERTDEKDGLGYNITALKHVAGLFDFVENDIAIEEPDITGLVPKYLFSPTGFVFSEVHISETNIARKDVHVTWNQVKGAVKYSVAYRMNKGKWLSAGVHPEHGVELHNLGAGTLEVMVVAISGSGARSQPGVSAPFVVGPLIKTPGFVTTLQDEVNAAQADATAAMTQINAISNDNLLTPSEKKIVIAQRDELTQEQADLDAQATAYGVTTEKTAYDNAITALTTYLATLTSPVLWSNLAGNTTIVGSTFRAKFTACYTTRQALVNKMFVIAKSIGDTAQTTASAAAANASAAISQLSDISNDNLLTPGEKPIAIKDRDTLIAEQSGIDAQAIVYGITTEKTTYDNAVTALTSYLATLTSPVLWTDLTGNTTIVGTTFRQKFIDVYSARTALLQKIADMVTFGNTAGRGVNLLFDEYSRFNSSPLVSLPANDTAHVTCTYDSTVNVNAANPVGCMKCVVNDATGTITNNYVRLANAVGDYPLALDGGKKYVVSASFMGSVAGIKIAFFHKDDDGTVRVLPDTAITTAFGRYYAVIDLTSLPNVKNAQVGAYLNRHAQTTSFTVWTDKWQVEEVVGAQAVPSNWVPGLGGRAAVAAQAAATAAQSDATSALNGISDIANDNLLTPAEKKIIIKDQAAIVAEQAGIDTQADDFGIVPEKSTYDTAITALNSYLATLTSPVLWSNMTGNTTIVRNTFKQKFLDVYSARQALLNAIYQAAQNLANGKIIAVGENLLTNPTFTFNDRNVTENVNIPYASALNNICDGWVVNYDGARNGMGVGQTAQILHWATVPDGITLAVNKPTALPNGQFISSQIGTEKAFPVKAGEQYLIGCGDMTQSFNGTATAGVLFQTRMFVTWFTSAGAQISQSVATQGRSSATSFAESVITAPAGATQAKLYMDCYVQNNSGAAWTHDSTVAMRCTFKSPYMVKRMSNTGYLPMLMYGNGRAKVPTVITYSAAAGVPATATINVAAFSIISGSRTISYNAMSVNLSHAAGNVQYYLYFDDPTSAGGSKTLVATTNGNDVYASEDRVYVGDCLVSFPSSGSSSGGGGRTDSCVCIDMYLHADVLAMEAEEGLVLDCIDLPSMGPVVFKSPMTGVEFDEVPCVELRCRNGAIWRGANTTPFDLFDGNVAYAPNMLGELVLTDCGITDVLEVIDLGVQPVAHIHVHGFSYAAGANPDNRVYSHNALKP